MLIVSSQQYKKAIDPTVPGKTPIAILLDDEVLAKRKRLTEFVSSQGRSPIARKKDLENG
ncbi:hypothetical protein [Tychonema sp. LEGE 07203]|uniref:hypothetical protein n=1 Tax=Tychonema sp. LEGE 07203 TaxID=1828671 RepID=UPI001881CB74|nr:hypothetical protein [Tychonema sp. LEGE 07203]MBE9092617.1 hypothetical protein [Tychonema sp. LEGE 07203]